MTIKSSVLERYSAGAIDVQPELCCPVDYDPELLAMLPQEIIDKDYGCGDPSPYVQEGDTVLDLGSGGGKLCYMAAQRVGAQGRVIGVDMNDDMLALARKYQSDMAQRLGGDRVHFLKGHIQDLALDLAALDDYLASHPVATLDGLEALQQWQQLQRQERPLIATDSVDLVISNCVLNLVDDRDKTQLLREIHRVLKPGGRVAISDIVSDEDCPASLKADRALWSGCISGAFQEKAFIDAFTTAGFLSVTIDRWSQQPWRVIDGIEFRAVTLCASKGSAEPCLDKGHAVIYRGPYREISDDEGHIYPRGERIAVCERTFNYLTGSANKDDFIAISPASPVETRPWCAPAGTRRPAAVTKGALHRGESVSASCC